MTHKTIPKVVVYIPVKGMIDLKDIGTKFWVGSLQQYIERITIPDYSYIMEIFSDNAHPLDQRERVFEYLKSFK